MLPDKRGSFMNQSFKPAPIAFFCFNRADKTKEVLEALAKNDLAAESEIFIFCDGPRNIKDLPALKEVHQVIDEISGFKTKHILKRELNYGIKNSITSGIRAVLENSENIIVVEDDILTAKNFLRFINEGLQFYKNSSQVWCVAGFNYSPKIIEYPKNYSADIFFAKGRNCAWGWGTWRDRWQKIDFEVRDYAEFVKDKNLVKEFNKPGSNMAEMLKFQMQKKIDTWDIQMSYSMFKNNAYTLHPLKTLVKNIGFDNSGTHTTSDLDLTGFEFENFSDFKLKKLEEIPDNDVAQNAFFKFHQDPNFLVRWARSKKKKRNLKWFLLGVLVCELINILFIPN